MKEGRPKVLVLLAAYAWPEKNAVASTLAWICRRKGWLFEVYYDAHRLGTHFGGGPLELADSGEPFGSTFWGGRHLERLLRLQTIADVYYVISGRVALADAIPADASRCIVVEADPVTVYRTILIKTNFFFTFNLNHLGFVNRYFHGSISEVFDRLKDFPDDVPVLRLAR